MVANSSLPVGSSQPSASPLAATPLPNLFTGAFVSKFTSHDSFTLDNGGDEDVKGSQQTIFSKAKTDSVEGAAGLATENQTHELLWIVFICLGLLITMMMWVIALRKQWQVRKKRRIEDSSESMSIMYSDVALMNLREEELIHDDAGDGSVPEKAENNQNEEEEVHEEEEFGEEKENEEEELVAENEDGEPEEDQWEEDALEIPDVDVKEETNEKEKVAVEPITKEKNEVEKKEKREEDKQVEEKHEVIQRKSKVEKKNGSWPKMQQIVEVVDGGDRVKPPIRDVLNSSGGMRLIRRPVIMPVQKEVLTVVDLGEVTEDSDDFLG
jgi:hypothetical protein